MLNYCPNYRTSQINLNGEFCTVLQFISDSSQQSVSENIHIHIQTSNMTIHWQCNDYYYIRIYACYFSLANHLLHSRAYNREDLIQTLVNSRLFYYKLVLQYNVTVDWPKINLLGQCITMTTTIISINVRQKFYNV